MTPEEKRARNTASIVKRLLSYDQCPRHLTYDCYFKTHIEGEDPGVADAVRDEFISCGFTINGGHVYVTIRPDNIHGGLCEHINDPALTMEANMRAFTAWADKRAEKFIKMAVKAIGRQQQASYRMQCSDEDQYLVEHANRGLSVHHFDFAGRASVIQLAFEVSHQNSIDGGNKKYHLVATPVRVR